MNLDRCTSSQREVIETLDAPLMVAAGAGSGKTFTLTQRIAHALLPDDEEKSFLASVDEVCAITFTDKAAAELRNRIKSQLMEEGLVDEALGVDDARISTIHAMAGRILRENALELGLDPSFEILTAPQVNELRAQAVEQVIDDFQENDPAFFDRCLADARTSIMEDKGIVARAEQLIERVRAMPQGFDGLVLARSTAAPRELMQELYDLGCSFYEIAQTWEKPKTAEQGCIDALAPALEGARAYLDSPEASEAAFEDDAFDRAAYRAAFYAFPPTTAKFHDKADDADFFANWRSEYARLSEEVEAGCLWPALQDTVKIARAIDKRFSALKGSARLDNTDLLCLCYEALTNHPDLAAQVRACLKLIMIDEFQDTDRLQVALISLLAQPQLANVCTVGDAQQSIYRFRGADVDVFMEYRENLCAQNPEAHLVSLPDNFRSHADILALVDAIFGQSQVFGEEFLHLEPHGAINNEHDPLFDEGSRGEVGGDADKIPRLEIDVVHFSPQSKHGVNSAVAREVAARHIAERFARLKEAGAPTSSMVLLLGKMTHAQVYMDALREVGLESIVTGGSGFASTDEALLVDNLLRYAVNTADEPALFAVLTSQLFALPDDVLLALASREMPDQTVRFRSLAQGFDDECAVDALGTDTLGTDTDFATAVLGESSQLALRMARAALRNFSYAADRGNMTDALRALFVETGLLDRLAQTGADGLARAGNLAKALSLVESFETESTGTSSLARAFHDHLSFEKETPGALATIDSDFVRIMTVHSAKGLEFDHVALAEMHDGTTKRDSFYAENIGNATYAALSSSTTSDVHGGVLGKLRDFEQLDAGYEGDEQGKQSAHAQNAQDVPDAHFTRNAASLHEHVSNRELAEARRLLYVGITRAIRSVMVSICIGSKPDSAYEKQNIYSDLHAALQWDIGAAKSQEVIECAPGVPVQVDFEYVQAADEEDEADAEGAHGAGNATALDVANANTEDVQADAFVVTRRPVPAPIISVAFDKEPQNVCSYTSLANATGALHVVVSDESDELRRTSDDTATDLGTAFHILSQRMIARRARLQEAAETFECVSPSADEIAEVARAQNLSDTQTKRLQDACARWYQSNIFHRFAASDNVRAEVPFMVALDVRGADSADTSLDNGVPARDDHFYLEGAIDLLASAGDTAYFVDFKTGGFESETAEDLYDKHLLQAQCYALALMDAAAQQGSQQAAQQAAQHGSQQVTQQGSQQAAQQGSQHGSHRGFQQVEACFVRVEHDDPENPDEPQTIKYSFTTADLDRLRAVVGDAWLVSARAALKENAAVIPPDNAAADAGDIA